MTSLPKLPATFSESDAQRILARAAELEVTTGGRYTIKDLQTIAEKAGIDARALESAINEVSASVESTTVDSSTELIPRGRLAFLATTGVLLGAAALGADKMNFPFQTEVAVFGPSALFSAWLALRHPLREGMIGLLRELAVAFGSFTIAVVAIDGIDSGSKAMGWSLLCGLVSIGIMSMRQRGREVGPEVTSATRVPTPVP